MPLVRSATALRQVGDIDLHTVSIAHDEVSKAAGARVRDIQAEAAGAVRGAAGGLEGVAFNTIGFPLIASGR